MAKTRRIRTVFNRRLSPAERLRLSCRLALQTAKDQFDRTHNPLFVWRAYETARSHKGRDGRIPEWVLKYFDACCSDLLLVAHFGKADVLTRYEPHLVKAGTAAIVAHLLNMKGDTRDGQVDVFTRYARAGRSFDLANRVAAYLREGHNETDAYYLVHRDRGASRTTVRRAWVRWNRYIS